MTTAMAPQIQPQSATTYGSALTGAAPPMSAPYTPTMAASGVGGVTMAGSSLGEVEAAMAAAVQRAVVAEAERDAARNSVRTMEGELKKREEVMIQICRFGSSVCTGARPRHLPKSTSTYIHDRRSLNNRDSSPKSESVQVVACGKPKMQRRSGSTVPLANPHVSSILLCFGDVSIVECLCL